MTAIVVEMFSCLASVIMHPSSKDATDHRYDESVVVEDYVKATEIQLSRECFRCVLDAVEQLRHLLEFLDRRMRKCFLPVDLRVE